MRSFYCLLVTLVTAATATSAFAQSERMKQNMPTTSAPKGVLSAPVKAKPNTPVTAPRPTSAKPLSTAECKQLGGTVGKSQVCNSGQSCTTYNQSNKRHEVCISAK